MAALERHWRRLFPSNPTIPSFLLAKSSPLNATQQALFSSYISARTLSAPAHLQHFCAAANLFCDLKTPANVTHDLSTDADFAVYNNNQFRRYQSGGTFDGDRFTNYSVDANVAHDSFLRYGQDANGRSLDFRTYEDNTNVAGSGFQAYARGSNGVSPRFQTYSDNSNVQRQDFASYGRDSSDIVQDFSSYSENSNVIRNGFKEYASGANGAISTFSAYATHSNIITNKFTTYDDASNGGSGTFNNYADGGNVVKNDFSRYAGGDGNEGSEEFSSYAGDKSGSPENVFTSYGRGENTPTERFTGYGNSSSPSTTEFVEYNRDAAGTASATFMTYVGAPNDTTFKNYFKSSASFNDYQNDSSAGVNQLLGKKTRRRWRGVGAGKFFREADLVTGNKIPLPDIRDKMPKRSFLPRYLADSLPFNSTKLSDLMAILGAGTMRGSMAHTVQECERAPSKGETKRCVRSLEDMAEFAASVLGESAWASQTESTAGSGTEVIVGQVAARKGATHSVSCHQSLFPYLVYYCHAVPRVRVYDVELLVGNDGDRGGNTKKNEPPTTTNHAVAICHLDTSQWAAGHAAFIALGPGPGKIEVCHFIFENDLIWVGRT